MRCSSARRWDSSPGKRERQYLYVLLDLSSNSAQVIETTVDCGMRELCAENGAGRMKMGSIEKSGVASPDRAGLKKTFKKGLQTRG